MASRRAWIQPDGLIGCDDGRTYQLVLTPNNLLGAAPIEDANSQGTTDQHGGHAIPPKGFFDTSGLDQT